MRGRSIGQRRPSRRTAGERRHKVFYTGSPYTGINTDFIGGECGFNFCTPVVPNPNAAADAAKFGTGMTGFVTFDFDTSGVSGTFRPGLPGSGIIEMQLVSGI